MPNSNHLMISTNTTPKPMDLNPEMKAVVSGSAADILKAMLKERQGRQEGDPLIASIEAHVYARTDKSCRPPLIKDTSQSTTTNTHQGHQIQPDTH